MPSSFSRRSMLAATAAACGVSALPMTAFAAPVSRKARALTPKEMRFVTALSDTLIPATETGGAIVAGVPLLLDSLMLNWASWRTRQEIRRTLSELNQGLSSQLGIRFDQASPEKRYSALNNLDTEVYSKVTPSAPERRYRDLKTIVVSCYYLSEIGASQELRYEHIPGRWDGCASYDSIGRNWVR